MEKIIRITNEVLFIFMIACGLCYVAFGQNRVWLVLAVITNAIIVVLVSEDDGSIKKSLLMYLLLTFILFTLLKFAFMIKGLGVTI